jgi:hypothetical protein
MGTLYDQKPRKQYSVNIMDAIAFYKMAKLKAVENGININKLIKVYELLIVDRRNNLILDNGDIHDEQMMGIGDLINKIIKLQNKIIRLQEEKGKSD